MVTPVADDTFLALIYASLAFGTLTCLILLFLIIHKLFCIGRRSNKKARRKNVGKKLKFFKCILISKLLKYLTTFHLLSYVLCNICWTFYWFWWTGKHPKIDANIELKLNLIISSHVFAILFWMFGSVSFLSVLILRLYLVFHNTEYQSPNAVFVGCAVLLLVICLIYVIFIIDASFPESGIDDNVFNDVMFPAVVSCNALVGISIIFLFGRKLFALAVSQSVINHRYTKPTIGPLPSTSVSSSSTMSGISRGGASSSLTLTMDMSPLDRQQMRFLRLICKNTLLNTMAITVIQIYLIFELVELYYKHNAGWGLFSYFLTTRWVLRSAAMSVEVLCVFLAFEVNDTLYRLLCTRCHTCLQVCCQRLMVKDIEREQERLELQVQKNIRLAVVTETDEGHTAHMR